MTTFITFIINVTILFYLGFIIVMTLTFKPSALINPSVLILLYWVLYILKKINFRANVFWMRFLYPLAALPTSTTLWIFRTSLAG